MLIRGLMVGGAALLAAAILQPDKAGADSYFGYQTVDYKYPSRPRQDDPYQAQLSCGQGRGVVRGHGFHAVRPAGCYGNVYRYRALRHRQTWRVRVDAGTGRILSSHRVGGQY